MQDIISPAVRALEAGDQKQAFQTVFENPSLFSKRIASQLQKGSAQERAFLDMIETIKQVQTASPNLYPFVARLGPIEKLWTKLENGSLRIETACKNAAAAARKGMLSAHYFRLLSWHLLEIAHQGHARTAMRFTQVLISALKAAKPEDEFDSIGNLVHLNNIEIGACAMCQSPSNATYTLARTAGLQLIDRARQINKIEVLADAFFRYGVLHLDPYASETTNLNWKEDYLRWQQRIIKEDEDDLADLVSGGSEKIPEATDALAIAIDALENSVKLREGKAKARSIKALVQAMVWLNIYTGNESNEDRIKELCLSSLPLLDRDRDAEHLIWLCNVLNNRGIQESSLIDYIVSKPVQKHVETIGEQQTVHIILQAIPLLSALDARRALGFIKNCRSFMNKANAESKFLFWQGELRALTKAEAPGIRAKDKADFLRLCDKTVKELEHSSSAARTELSFRLVALASLSSTHNEELRGLSMLDQALVESPGLLSEHGDALHYLQATGWSNLGVTHLGAQEHDDAIWCYYRALKLFLGLPLASVAHSQLVRIAEVLVKGKPEVPQAGLALFGDGAACLEVAGVSESETLKMVTGSLALRVLKKELRPQLLFHLSLIAKGLASGVTLRKLSEYNYLQDECASEILDQIHSLSSELGLLSFADRSPNARFDEDLILSSPIQQTLRSVGSTDADRLENLEYAFDADCTQKILQEYASYMTEGPQESFGIEDVQQRLDDRTVIADFFEGPYDDGTPVLYCTLITREASKFACVVNDHFRDLDPALLKWRAEGRELRVDYLGLVVKTIRNELKEVPGNKPVTDHALQLLQEYRFGFLRSAESYLNEWHKAGKDHLCIVPTGALHFLPWHLLGSIEATLSHTWIVTYLPNMRYLLRPKNGQKGSCPQNEIVSFGISYERHQQSGQANLPPLPQSINEASEIAEIFGVKAVSAPEATKSKFLEALKASKYVHISAHGRHNFMAPSFQCVFLEGNEIEPLYAYELLPNDFRSVKLATLSACESALGRFDEADNLRGFALNLLRCGVAAVIGSLWDANADCTQLFHHKLYSLLHAGASLLDAYRNAQIAARDSFPEYRDWGAFYFSGDWRD